MDLCLTTHPDYIEQCTTVPGFSDHDAVVVDLTNLCFSRNKYERKIYLCNRMLSEMRFNAVSDMYFNLNKKNTRTVEQIRNFFMQTFC